MISGDFHMHSTFSSDSKATMETMIEASIAKGLKTICFTDHYDEDYPKNPAYGQFATVFDVSEYQQKIQTLQKKYQQQIEVLMGIELGIQSHLGEFYHQLVAAYSFDFVLGSVHVVEDEDPSFRYLFKGKTDEEVYRSTFLTTIEAVKAVKDFDSLGHLDYVTRYGGEQEKHYSYRKFADYIDEIFRLLIDSGRGIELNTAGLKYGLPYAHPHMDSLKRYRELGGEIITIGSDAHRPEHVAYDYHLVEGILQEAGFSYYTIFKERKPIFRKVTQ